MKLSIAIRLGSLLVTEPEAANIDACAVTMAVKATGDIGEPQDRYETMLTRWPWLKTANVCCPCAQGHGFMSTGKLHGSFIVFVPFDAHVMHDRTLTIEQLADWIATIEPEEESVVELVPAETNSLIEVAQ